MTQVDLGLTTVGLFDSADSAISAVLVDRNGAVEAPRGRVHQGGVPPYVAS
jgi:hypothetical protein